jgi:hypothetical protein
MSLECKAPDIEDSPQAPRRLKKYSKDIAYNLPYNLKTHERRSI